MALFPLFVLVPFCEDSMHGQISAFNRNSGILVMFFTALYHVMSAYLTFNILYFGPWSANIDFTQAASVGIVHLMATLVFLYW
jgi:hypothetical protein